MKRIRIVAAMMFLILPASVFADQAQDSFVDGLSAMTEGKFAEAADAFAKATAANDEAPIYHLDHAVALMMALQPNGVTEEMARVSSLDPRNADLQVWAVVRLEMFENRSGGLPYNATPYAREVIEAATRYNGQLNRNQKADPAPIQRVAIDWAWKQLGTLGSDALLARVQSLYTAGHYSQCLAMIDHVRAQGPLNATILGYSAHCKLGLRDYASSREEYTAALRWYPLTAAWVIGRARCEIAMGSLDDANADFALARRMDSKMTDRFVEDAKDLITEARGKIVQESTAAALANLKQGIAAGKSDADCFALAERLERAAEASRFVYAEAYTRQYANLFLEVNADPQSVPKLAALAKFLIKPTVLKKINADEGQVTAEIPCLPGNWDVAADILQRALKIAPNDVPTLVQEALLLRDLQRPADMIYFVEKAMAQGGQTLNLCVMYLDYYTAVADDLSNHATALRTPTVTTYNTDEGEYVVTHTVTHYPTPEALAQADQLDKQADAMRVKAHTPLQNLAAKTKGSSDPKTQALNNMANAYHYQWIGKYDTAIPAAQAALKADPYNLVAIEFLVDLCPKVGLRDMAIGFQNMLDNAANPSVRFTMDSVKLALGQTKTTTADQLLDQAEAVAPADVQIPIARFDVAKARNNLDDAVAAARLVVAMEEGRLRLGGQSLMSDSTKPLRAQDAVKIVSMLMTLGQLLDDANRADDAVAQYQRGLVIAARVPWKKLEPAFTAEQQQAQAKDPDFIIMQQCIVAHRQVAYKLLARNDYQGALEHCLALVRLGVTNEPNLSIGFQIYQHLGFGPFAGQAPDGWQPMFMQMQHMRENDRQFGRNTGDTGNAEIWSINNQINQINREIQHGVGNDELLQLTAQRDKLQARLRMLQQQQGH